MAPSSEKMEWLKQLGALAGATGPADVGSSSGRISPTGDTEGIVVDLPSHEEPNQPEQEVVHDTLSYETEPIRKQARNDFPDEVDLFVNLWMAAGIDALAGAPEAEEPESQAGWWIALAGNLIWAATCLVPPAKALQIAIMSFGGAAAGSGVFSPNSEKAPSGKKMISGMLTQARDAMIKAAGPIMDLAATQCGDKQITAREEQRKVLWNNLFNTPFDESEPIRQQMSVKIEAGLQSYNEQWHTWRKEIHSLAAGYANESQSSDMDSQGGRGVEKRDYERAMKEHPFKPKLSFD